MLEPERGRENLERGPQLRLAPEDPFGSPQWNNLANANDEATFSSAWLALQCSQIAGVTAGWLVVRDPEKGAALVSARWPEREIDFGDLSRLADRAYAERRVVVGPGRVGPEASPAQRVTLIVAVPLGAGAVRLGVAAVALTTSHGASPVAPEAVAAQLKWGAGWLEALPWIRRLRNTTSRAAQTASIMDLLAVIGEQTRLRGMAIALVNDLTARLHCDRVSLGVLRRNGMMRLSTMSHSTTFKSEGRLTDAIENAMEEAVDQCASVVDPPLSATARTAQMAHSALSDVIRVPGASVMTVVLSDGEGKVIGALTFERHGAEPFDHAALQWAEAIAALIGPTLALQLRANRPLAGSIVDRVGDAAAALIGPGRPALKLAAAAAAVVMFVLMVAQGEHRVTAKSVLEAEVLRAAVAPFDGFIRSAGARAGDVVHADDMLAELDDRDLVLDRLKWRAERETLVQKQRDALAKHQRSDIVVLESQIRQAEAQLKLAEEKLSRVRIVAPFDGVVVTGDLSQTLGAPVEKGKTLFEIAPPDAYRLIVQVDERDVRYVVAGQHGTVAIAGTPGRSLPIVLTKITPVSVAEEGQNFFRIEAQLTELVPDLRPGMEGVAKIEVGRRSLIWIWTHAVVDILRLTAWKYLP